MLEILLSVAVGIVVSIFGMWCFIRGQQNGIQMSNKEVPKQINNPVTAVVEAVQEIKENSQEIEQNKKILSINDQVMSMLHSNYGENDEV